MQRLFIAIDLPDERIDGLRDLRDDTLEAKWTPSDQYHITLRFLGDTDEVKTQELQERLSDVDLPSFLIGGEGLDVFPSIRKPRVLVAKIGEDPGLMALQRDVADTARELGFDEDRKPFNPHVTVARLKSAAPRSVRRYLKSRHDFSIAPFVVDSFRLYESRLGGSGAVHRVLHRYALRTAFPADGG